MEKVKISAFHIFVLIFLFEAGSVFLVTIGQEVHQDAWIAVLFGLIGGLVLFWVFYRLYEFYPDILPTTYVKKLFGKYVGSALALLYLTYSAFMSAVVLRTFGEYMITFSYPDTPMFVINLLLILVMIYGIQKGIEVIGRTGEFLFFIAMLITFLLGILLMLSKKVNLKNLTPVLENGISPILNQLITQTLYVPFGELVIFALLLPFVKKTKKMKLVIFSGVFFSGLVLTISKMLNIAVLGSEIAEGSLLPTLDLIQSIDVLEYLQRLDIFFIFLLVIGAFIKSLIFFYVAVSGMADLFSIKKSLKLIIPIGIVILMLSLFMTTNIVEQLKLNIKLLPIYVHFPFQVIFPIIMLIVAYIKNRGKVKKPNLQDEQSNQS